MLRHDNKMYNNLRSSPHKEVCPTILGFPSTFYSVSFSTTQERRRIEFCLNSLSYVVWFIVHTKVMLKKTIHLKRFRDILQGLLCFNIIQARKALESEALSTRTYSMTNSKITPFIGANVKYTIC